MKTVELPVKGSFIVEEATYDYDKFFKIIRVLFKHKLPKGGWSPKMERLIFERGASVGVVVRNVTTDTIELTHQFRLPTYGFIEELPAGMVGKDEAAWDCAVREVEEELGYVIHNMQFIGSFYVSPGGTSEEIYLYYAEVSDEDRIGEGGGKKSENEYIELIQLPVHKIKDYLLTTARDAKTIIGLQWFLLHIDTKAEKDYNHV